MYYIYIHINVVNRYRAREQTPIHAWQYTGCEPDLCSVHEDRVDEERRASGQTRGGGEVAGLEDVDDSCVATVTSSVPGAGGIRSHRRIRPLSLAVQPLNYHRLDPDQRLSATIGARHHPNMTSQESIGSCSLDVDRSASDRSGWLSTHWETPLPRLRDALLIRDRYIIEKDSVTKLFLFN